MNELIQKLAASHFPRDGEGNIQATPEIIAEFAESIVLECVCWLSNREFASPQALKQHFGVEQ